MIVHALWVNKCRMNVLIFQTVDDVSQTLVEIFTQRGDNVIVTFDFEDAKILLENQSCDLVVIDLHLPQDALHSFLRDLSLNYPNCKTIVSNRYPDLSREIDIKEQGTYAFLRAPFNKSRVEQAIKNVQEIVEKDTRKNSNIQTTIPRVRNPVSFQIILPYLLLSLLLAMGAGFVVSQVALDAIEERFLNNLIEAGQLSSAWMVEEETNRLETLRLIAFTGGLGEAIINQDSEQLRDLVLGITINNQEDAVEIINIDGVALLSLRHLVDGGREAYDISKGDDHYLNYDFIQKVLSQQDDDLGDKYAGVIQTSHGDYFYIAGPIVDNENQLIGAVLVGQSLSRLVFDTRENLLGAENTFAHISLYDFEGHPLSSTHVEFDDISIPEATAWEILDRQDEYSKTREINVAGIDYQEIIGAWEVRGGEDIGLFGVSLAETFLVRPSQVTQVQIFLIASFGFLLIITIGILLASRITRPLNRVVSAASQVSQGKLDVNVEPQGSDELAYLAHAFNDMVSHLREGEIYRDLLGRTITPQVRDQLRRGLASGNLRLEGQNTTASIMITDIRKFTVIAENQAPTQVLSWLNQYYGELVPIINAYDGVTNEFVGDSLMAFFGILPINLDPSESALQACSAAVDILRAVKTMNKERLERDEPPLVTGIGINTGEVAAGGMGTADRLHYSVIGDSVNVTQRLENMTKELGETSAIISQYTYVALDSHREKFSFIPLGSHVFKGKSESIDVYRLLPKDSDVLVNLLNINTASIQELKTLDGISTNLARKISLYRSEQGNFKNCEEITKVKGISKQKYATIKDQITV